MDSQPIVGGAVKNQDYLAAPPSRSGSRLFRVQYNRLDIREIAGLEPKLLAG